MLPVERPFKEMGADRPSEPPVHDDVQPVPRGRRPHQMVEQLQGVSRQPGIGKQADKSEPERLWTRGSSGT